MNLRTETVLDAEALKLEFPILRQPGRDGVTLVYLDSAASSQRPQHVLDAMQAFETRRYANVHRGSHFLSDEATEAYEDARGVMARFLGAANDEEIIFTRNTTEGINLVARSWGDANVRAGDAIVLTLMEHHSNIVPWQQLAERTGAEIRWLPLDESGRLRVEELPRLLEGAKLLAVTAISNTLGTINPVRELADAAHAAGALILVDAAQAAPHEAIDVVAWDADFAACSGHKMCGPGGAGVLYGRRALLEAMPPFLGGGSMIHRVDQQGFTPAALPAKFEAGTPAITAAVGIAAAADFLQQVGLANIKAHEQTLAELAHQQLAEIPGVRFLGPPPAEKAGIVTMAIDGVHPNDAAELLDARGVAVRAGHHCTMPLHEALGLPASLRASFYLYNTPGDVAALAEGIASAVAMLR